MWPPLTVCCLGTSAGDFGTIPLSVETSAPSAGGNLRGIEPVELHDDVRRQHQLLGSGQPESAAYLQRDRGRVVVLLSVCRNGMPRRTDHPGHARRAGGNTTL